MTISHFHKIGIAMVLGFAFTATTEGQCPDSLLWTNGKIWAYRAIECGKDDLGNCGKATEKVLYYDNQVDTTGCEMKEDACNCRLEKNEPLFSNGAAPEGGYESDSDMPIQNRGCQSIDAFVVKIGEAHYQCVEFRFVPDTRSMGEYGQVARNMRVSFRLKVMPEQSISNLLQEDSAKLDGGGIVRKVGEQMVMYPLLKSGVQTLNPLPAPKPVETTDPATPPNPSEDTSRSGPGPDDSGGSGGSGAKADGSDAKADGSGTK